MHEFGVCLNCYMRIRVVEVTMLSQIMALAGDCDQIHAQISIGPQSSRKVAPVTA
jgi:hypothetical protein